jgi:hypothetical protein
MKKPVSDDFINGALSGADDGTVFACARCNAEIDFGTAETVTCPDCGTSLRRPYRVSAECLRVIVAHAPEEQRDYWVQRAKRDELSPARLRAEIKYTAWEYVYGSSPTSGGRRGKCEIEGICAALYNALKEDAPMTVRQVFYRLVSQGVIAKTEGEYKATVCRLLAKMRREGEVPFSWVADNTRWMRKPRTYSSLESMLRTTAEAYRRSVWDNQDAYVEIWLEKDALAGVLMEETAAWDVPLMVVRGFSSLTFLHSAAETIAEVGKPTYLYYFGDYDPSGLVIPKKIEEDLREFAPAAEIHFERVAVTHQQIEELSLPTRPTKKTDSRSKNFRGESVEVDAIPSRKLREIVRDCITQHVDEREYEALKVAEASERETLLRLVEEAA